MSKLAAQALSVTYITRQRVATTRFGLLAGLAEFRDMHKGYEIS